MTGEGRVVPPDRSTLSRRVRGVLSPYRERGIRRLRGAHWGVIPAYAGMTDKGQTYGAVSGSRLFTPWGQGNGAAPYPTRIRPRRLALPQRQGNGAAPLPHSQ